jgi:hypothetical protein
LSQQASLMPVVGVLLARVFTESVFFKTCGEVSSVEHPLDRELAARHLSALRDNDPGGDIQRKLLRFIPERAAHPARFDSAMERTQIPLSPMAHV